MAMKIKCHGLFCRSTDITQVWENTRTSVNLNPIHSHW